MYRVYRGRSVITLIAAFMCFGAKAATDDHEWSGVISAAAGHDDNLTQEDNTSAVASGLDDNYIEVLGGASRYLSGVKNNGFRVTGTLFSRNYISKNDYDYTVLGVWVGKDKTLAKWKARFDAGYDYSTYGGNTYQRVTKLRAEGRHELSKKTELRLRYEANFIDASGTYSNLNGTRQYLRAETRFKQGKNRYRLSYTYETNDRDDSRSGTSFSSDSPNRHIFRAKAKIVPEGR